MISAEVLIAVTGSLAVLVLLLLPVEFFRYKLKQARGRQILKRAKRVARTNGRTVRQPPFMGTPLYLQRDRTHLVHGKNNSTGDLSTLHTNYSSNAQTMPHFLPKLDTIGLKERDVKKKSKRKRRKNSLGSSEAIKSGSSLKGLVNPMHVGDDDDDLAETDDVIAHNRGGDTSARSVESHALRDLTKSRSLTASYFREAEKQLSRSYENHVSLEDEQCQQNVFSLGNHKLPSINATQTQSSPNIGTQSPYSEPQHSPPPVLELERRDVSDFVV